MEANKLFDELAKNNYQATSERSVGRRQGGLYEVDWMSSLEVKFEAPMTKLNQQTPKEPTSGEIAFMKAQGVVMTNPSFQVEEVNYVNNRVYAFRVTDEHKSHLFSVHFSD